MTGSEAVSSGSSSVSSTLLEQLRSGRPEAWKRFVPLYGPIIYRWCRRSGLVAEDAADILQEVLLAVLLHLTEFRRDRTQDSFSGWLAAITRNKVRDHYRRQCGKAEARGGSTVQRQMAEIPQPERAGKGDKSNLCEAPGGPFRQISRVPFSRSDESIRPDAESDAWLSQRALEMIRAEFETHTWDAFWRTTVDGQPPAGVAADLQMSVPAVYTAKSRVLRRLRQVMSELPR